MADDTLEIAGWDIGGAHVKAAYVAWQADEVGEVRTAVRPFEVWHEREKLSSVIGQVADELGLRSTEAMAVTMTAELSDAFRTKREGVLFVLDQVQRAFPDSSLWALDIAGDLAELESARLRPLDFAATNWVASALFVAARCPDCILIDVGSTTTDIIPIRGGRIVCEGRTDLARLVSGELIYTGVVRTNPNTLAPAVPVRGRACRVAAEHFAVMADVYVLLARLTPAEYTCSTPDGRARSRQACAERLARLLCADGEALSEEEIVKVARYLFERQVQQVSDGLLQVLSRLEGAYGLPLAVAGAGAFLATEVGCRLGLAVLEPEPLWGGVGSVALPASAAACLLAQRLQEERR